MQGNYRARVWFAGEYPKCFDSREDYRAWKQAAFEAGRVPFELGVCADCTSKYKERMTEEGRCENTHVSFRYSKQDMTTLAYVHPDDLKKAKEARK